MAEDRTDEEGTQLDPHVANVATSRDTHASVTVPVGPGECDVCAGTGALPAASHIEGGKTVIDKWRDCPNCHRAEVDKADESGVLRRTEIRVPRQ